MRRRFALVAVAVALVSACGDSSLFADLGERSHEYVEGTTTIPPLTVPPDNGAQGITLKSVSKDTSWFNDGIDTAPTNETAVVISAVWQRGNGLDRFIQASPNEISAALPGVLFPTLVPRTTTSITSQLVYDTASATLDADVSAAFGLWAGEPYSQHDDQVAVLRVGQEVTVDRGDGLRLIEVDDGISLIWADEQYQYELFCVGEMLERQCRRMARSAEPLETLIGG